jgi:phosphopantothenoylcysteine decarboxylase/phosphopantothenate--cysteine ligase
MGAALARAFEAEGADVVVVSGPGTEPVASRNIQERKISSAAEMLEACKEEVEDADIAVFAAAVADFTPEEVRDSKVKRGAEDLVLRLKPSVDIAGTLGKAKRAGQFFVGFALETDEGLENAKGKLERKNLDMIVLNSLQDAGAGFGVETNKVSTVDKWGNIDIFDLKPKSEVAVDIADKIKALLG